MQEAKQTNPVGFPAIYASFRSPIAEFDCGKKCAPYNENGVPFCCDTGHAVPTAYNEEWEYLRVNTVLWHLWEAEDNQETERLLSETPDGQVLIACLGHEHCQRGFRAFPAGHFPFSHISPKLANLPAFLTIGNSKTAVGLSATCMWYSSSTARNSYQPMNNFRARSRGAGELSIPLPSHAPVLC
jgi:hypothetical protein